MRLSKLATGMMAFAVVAAMLTAGVALGGKGGGGGGGAPTYAIVSLDDARGAVVGTLNGGANDINEHGDVVGTVEDADNGTSVAAFWEVDGTQSQIFPLNGGLSAYGLNNFNEVVGSGSSSIDPPNVAGFYWSSPTSQPVALPPLPGGLASIAYAISDDGVICGYARELVRDADGTPIGSTDVAVVWRLTYADGELQIVGPVPLPTLDDRSHAYSVSENDTAGLAIVVGVFMTSGFSHTAAVQWTVQSHQDGTLTVDPNPVLSETGNAAALGLNNLGVSCGEALDSSPETDALVWFGGSGLPLASGGFPQTGALDVNDAGVIVGFGGQHTVIHDALVWPSATSQPVLLNKFLPKRNSPFAFLQSSNCDQ